MGYLHEIMISITFKIFLQIDSAFSEVYVVLIFLLFK